MAKKVHPPEAFELRKETEDDGVRHAFRRFSERTSAAVGSPAAFGLALAVVLAWAVTGPLFHFSDTWQLVINTGTTIVTFLMVFVIQYTQNRESRALLLKLDELLRANGHARNRFIGLEDLSDAEHARLRRELLEMRRFDREARAAVGADQGEGRA